VNVPSNLRSSTLPSLAVLLAACGGLIQGFDTGGISNSAAAIALQFHVPEGAVGIITSLVLVGAMPGALFGGRVADAIGRRGALVACGAVFVLGVLIELFASSLGILLAGRFVAGLAIGASSTVSTLYISEVSPPTQRGANLALFQFAVVLGIVCGILTAMVAGPTGWHLIMGIGLVPGMTLFCGMAAMPESPVWKRGGTSEKHDTHGLFAAPGVQLALVAGVGMALIQQITGINAVMYYAPGIFEKAGFTNPGESLWDDLSLAVLLCIVTFLASRMVDRFGRRALLLWGLGGMVVSLAVLGSAFAVSGSSMARWFILGGLLSYIAFFALGPGPCIWLVIAEIFPRNVRGPAMGVATLASWLANFLVSSTFPAFSLAVGEANAFFVFCLIAALSWLFTFGLLPETAGRTLDEIQAIWTERATALFNQHTIIKL